MRSLRPEEQALWAKVVQTVEPLSRDPAERTKDTAPPERPSPDATDRSKSVARRSAVTSPAPIVPPTRRETFSDSTLDGGWDRRLRQGRVAPDRVIDLHGHRLDDAWEAIDRGLEAAVRAGDRLILLITGHPPRGEPPVQRGRIRAAVHDWLGASRHAEAIAAVRPAAGRHGGRGALYLVLRRRR